MSVVFKLYSATPLRDLMRILEGCHGGQARAMNFSGLFYP
jgi:hypothetical protein